MRYFITNTILAALLALPHAARGETISFEKASSQLQAATVTVRVIPAKPQADELAPEEAALAKQVIVCSGASLGDGLVITYADIEPNDEVRITIPGGEQATAKLKVLDHVSGLTLLETDKADTPSLGTAKEMPSVGAWVLTGAGWGSEKPLVSFGILAGVNRTMRGANFPPLLQCDLRTADTSNGAPLVNQDGELIGVIVASGAGEAENRWAYAVPVKHVRRLVRARHPEQMIELKKVRPVVGMTLQLGDTPGKVIVEHVFAGGPAEKAGVQVGDQIMHSDGMKIRSPYQVIGPVLAKQPGETMNFTVGRDGKEHKLEIVLGGGTILQAKPSVANIAGLKSAGQVDLSRVLLSADDPKHEEIIIRRTNASADNASGDVKQQIDQLELQRKAISTYLSALQAMQTKIKSQEQRLAERDAEIEALRKQVEALRESR